MTPIVFQALPKWDGNYNSTALTISKMLSQSRKVFYVEHPFSIIDWAKNRDNPQIKRRMNAGFEMPFQDHPNFYVIHPPLTFPINSLPNGVLYQTLLHAYIKKLWKRIDAVLDEFNVSSFGYVNSFDPVYFEFESRHTCEFTVYHSVDLIEGEPYIAKHGVTAERRASCLADYVVTTSLPLENRLQKYNPNTTCIANAADFNHFSRALPEPEEYKSIEGRKIVYTGNIGLRIDYALIKQLANENPDDQLVLVGPKDPQYFAGQELEAMPNVHFLGPKSYTELPAYIQHADVCLIPFLCNALTHHIYPLKLNEYFATGKPIVTTRFTIMEEFEELLHVIDEPGSISKVVKEAFGNDSRTLQNARIKKASYNTWEHRIKDWNDILEAFEANIFIEK